MAEGKRKPQFSSSETLSTLYYLSRVTYLELPPYLELPSPPESSGIILNPDYWTTLYSDSYHIRSVYILYIRLIYIFYISILSAIYPTSCFHLI